MYMNLHIKVYGKNMETKNWVSDSSKQWNGNKILAAIRLPKKIRFFMEWLLNVPYRSFNATTPKPTKSSQSSYIGMLK